jgi:hypothetical protein
MNLVKQGGNFLDLVNDNGPGTVNGSQDFRTKQKGLLVEPRVFLRAKEIVIGGAGEERPKKCAFSSLTWSPKKTGPFFQIIGP